MPSTISDRVVPESPDARTSDALAGRDDADTINTDTMNADAVAMHPNVDTGEVPDKQLFRWKDDGGALHPDA